MSPLHRSFTRVSYMTELESNVGKVRVIAELDGGEKGLLVVSIKGTGATKIYCPSCKLVFSPKYSQCPNNAEHPAELQPEGPVQGMDG